jgi:predicted amidohydrolase YtcJ
VPDPADPRPVVLRAVRLAGADRPLDVRLAGGRVAAVAEASAGGRELARPGDEVVHHPGAHLLPGFVDGHVHWTQWAQQRRRVDVGPARSATEAVGLIAASGVRGALVHARGYRSALWAEQPHKDLLERALPGVAVAVVSMDLHAVWLSPAALARLGVDHPTGVLREQAGFDAQRALSALEPADVVDRWVAEASAAAAARGITEVVDFEFADTAADWTRRAAAGALPLRVRAAVWAPWLDAAVDAGRRTGDPLPGTRGLVRTGPLKIIADGSLNTRTAYCSHPYPDPADGHGQLLVEPDELRALMARGAAHGLRPAVHAIGDRANAVVLDAFEAVGGGGRIEHAQLVAPADLPRFARAGLVASVQPQHAVADRDVADRHWADAAPHAFPYGALHAAGARLELGSDAPVSPPDPWAAVADAVTRTDDERPPWHPEQAIPLPVALRAAAAGRDAPGVGEPADLVLVGADPLRTPPRDLRQLPVLATFRGGECTFRADP